MSDLETRLLEIENRILHTETLIREADVYRLNRNVNLYERRDDPETQAFVTKVKKNIAVFRQMGWIYGVYSNLPVTLEHSAYGWRRDFGEWPTVWNLADRHAHDRGVTRETARKAITKALNDNGPRRQLFAASSALIDAILTDEEPDWSQPRYTRLADMTNFRLYVSPEGIEQFHCRETYENGIRSLEKLIA